MAAVPAVARASIVFTTLAVLGSACSEPRSTEPDSSGPVAAKAPTGPTVSAAVPDNAPQDTTLDVQVAGSGFDLGSRVDLALAGVLDPVNVYTNSTRFVSSTSLVANITISATATLAYYDVVVQTSKGKKGIGTELFAIRAYNDIGALGSSGATPYGVNATGTIVGASIDRTGYGQGFVWTEAVGMRALPRLAGTGSAASAINEANVIVGHAGPPVRWVPTGLGTWSVQSLNLPTQSGIALAINDNGVIAGYFHDLDGTSRPFRWNNGVTAVLPMPAGAWTPWPRGISLAGTAVGYVNVSIPELKNGAGHRAVAWPAEGGVIELPLCPRGIQTDAYAINDAGVIVGICRTLALGKGPPTVDTTYAVRWLPDPTTPDAWLAPEVLSGSRGCFTANAWDINNAGEIVGDRCAQPFLWDEVQGLRALAVKSPNGNGSGRAISEPAPGGQSLIAGSMWTTREGRAVWWRHP